MESLKLKLDERSTLYYNKHKYRVQIFEPYVHLLRWYKSISEVKLALGDETRKNLSVQPDFTKIRKIIKIKNMFEKLDDAAIRQEGDKITFYCNDTDLIDQIGKSIPDSTVSEVALLPAGVKYFTNEPDHKYRVYLKSKRIQSELKSELLDYLTRTTSVTPSGALSKWMNYSVKYQHVYTQQNFFVDYDDAHTLTMMHLLFPSLIGKSFKLEKRK